MVISIKEINTFVATVYSSEYPKVRVRIVKAVSCPADEGALLAFLRGFAQDYLRKQEGNRGVWIKVDTDLTSKFFLQSSWETAEHMSALFETETYKNYIKQLKLLGGERLLIWDTDLIMSKPSNMVLAKGQDVWIRLIKLGVSPGQVEQSYSVFNEVTVKAMAAMPGFVHLQLLHDEDSPLTVFIESWWNSHEALSNMVENSTLKNVRADSVALLEERMTFWMLKLVDDDPKFPVLRPRLN